MRHVTSSAGLALATFLVLNAAFTPTEASAQGAATRPIFLALPNEFPNLDARVVLVREGGREIVVLDPAAATADELIMGLRLLNRVRRERPNPTTGEVIPLLGFYPPELSAQERERLEAVIAELRGRPLANVGNLGRGRWMPYVTR
jgi:hypothetical protein